MLSPFALFLYITICTLYHAQSIRHNTFCVSGSILSSQVNGKYVYKDSNTNGFIYFDNKLNLYLFPWVESENFKQYLIGPDASIHSAYSFSTIQALSPYRFNENDFITNWQSYVTTNNTNTQTLQKDESMRLVSCTSVCIDSILYEWITYNVSMETSIYFNASNGLYLYRSDIATYEKWQIYNTSQTIYNTVSVEDIHIGSCMQTNIDIATANVPSYTHQYETMRVTKKQAKYGVIATLFAATSAILLVFIFMAHLIKRYVLDPEERSENVNKASKPSNKSSANELQIRVTTPNLEDKSKHYKICQPKSTLSINVECCLSSDDEYMDNHMHNVPLRKMTNSVVSNSPRSNSRYADILPPTKPPPIGMRPILTAKQQLTRPLPLTPPARKTTV